MDSSTITASKLFKTSKRKDDILGKLNSLGSSVSLKIQEIDQVDDNAVNPEDGNINDREDLHSVPVVPQEDVELDNNSSLDSVNVKDIHKVNSENTETEENVSDTVTEDSSDSNKEGEEVESSESVNAASLPRTDVTDNLDLEVKSVKGLLNANSSTSGVSRVSVRDDKELWVYYNDNVNLNDVMVNVIEFVNASGYSYLEFNRLARSENAVVFVILRCDTDRSKVPVVDKTSKE